MFFPIFFIIVIFNCFNEFHANRASLAISNDRCSLQHGSQTVREGELVAVQNKIYKVEECRLERAYQTCGTNLWLMLNVVCDAIHIRQRKQINRLRRFVERKLLTEACCDQACTISEMTGFCANL